MRLLTTEFSKTTGLASASFPWLAQHELIVRLRDLVKINLVVPMPDEYLTAILSNVTFGQPEVMGFAYRDCPVEQIMIEPLSLHITQNFVQTDKLNFFDKKFGENFSSSKESCYCSSECSSLIVCGVMEDGTPAMCHYLPPIIEEHRGKKYLLEGMHRCYTSWQRGGSQRVLLIKEVEAPFPWTTVPWKSVPVVREKPPVEKRKFGGDPRKFRHFLPVGLDT